MVHWRVGQSLPAAIERKIVVAVVAIGAINCRRPADGWPTEYDWIYAHGKSLLVSCDAHLW
jgi:hypothetical protein